MLSPILRLLATYLAVGLVVFAFFNRDRLSEMLGSQGPQVVAAVEAEPERQPTASPQPRPAPGAAPVFAPPPGENGVPEEAQMPLSTPPRPAPAPALQSPTPPAQTLPTQIPAPTPLQAPSAPAASAPAQTTPKDRLEPQLAAARSAYWQGDAEAAIARYRDLLAQYPDNETLHGELGNIYYMNGERLEAAKQYEAAGMAALKAGRRQQAQMLLGVLSTLERAAAARLQQAMEGNQ